jgi:hypothetical protein
MGCANVWARNVDEMTLGTCGRYKVSSVVSSHDMAHDLTSGARAAGRVAVLRELAGGRA